MDFVGSFVNSILSGAILAAVTGIFIRRYMRRQEKKDEEKSKVLFTVLEGNSANMLLSQAIATELIENGKCNGKTTSALEYSKKIKSKQDEILLNIVASNL